ncbi:MAG: ATP-binding protein [Mariprofundaceae bacterium]
MTLGKKEFIRRYIELLHAYVKSPAEKHLAAIESLGQEMLLLKLPPEEIGEMHDLAIAHLIESSDLKAKEIRAVSLPLMQLLMAYGVAFRSLLARKQAEECLHLASRAIATTMEGIIITDDKGTILDVNRAFERVTGYTKIEAIGNMPSMLQSGKQDESFYQNMWRSIGKSGQWQGQIWNKRKDGEIYPEHLSISAIYNDEDVLTNYVGVFSDISEQLSLEEQFRQAQKMEAIGTLVGGIAHDFNNMLAGMTGNLYLAKKELKGTPDVLLKLTNVEQLSFRAAEMIQQLLTFARKGHVSMQQLSFAPLIKETLKLLRTSVPENIKLHRDICYDSLEIHGDGTQLHQVLMNLINNARDAVEGVVDPRITIRLEAFQTDEAFLKSHTNTQSGRYAHLSVEDNGCGIPEDQIEHLFEPFFTTKEQGKGSGLGLAMVYGAVKTHHGFVEVDSIEGKGSTFHIYLPLLESEGVTAASAKKEAVAQGQGETILLADDEFHLRESFADVLAMLGYKVLTAKDGVEALEVFKAHQQDIALVMLDVVMPHCSGTLLAKRIRKVNPDVPVIFVTGYDKEHVLGSGEQIQNSDAITKPFKFDVLSHSIRRLLD